MNRFFSKTQRKILALIAGGRCENCGKKLDKAFHADHIIPHSKGGKTIIKNGAALCPQCNQKKGSKTMDSFLTQKKETETVDIFGKLRPWQLEVLSKAINWYSSDDKNRNFLIDAAPGAGKTIAACVIAKGLLEKGFIERVIVIAPRNEVVKQWAQEYQTITGRFMGKVTGTDDDFKHMDFDICATWAAVRGLCAGFQEICNKSNTLIICDEHHHASSQASWGEAADKAFENSRFNLILSGTPIRSDGETAVWLEVNQLGKIQLPPEGRYSLTYGEAVDLGYCRPVTFHRHEGRFDVVLDNETIQVSGTTKPEATEITKRFPTLKRVLNFYKCAQTGISIPGTDRADPSGYQGSMIEYASSKLDELRYRMPDAGGLVIAPNIKMAEYFCDLIRQIEGEEPTLVHSEKVGSEQRIAGFRASSRRWIVSVAMISEGVDIPRLRVLVYLPNSQTELSFRQSIGRIVRNAGPTDDTRGYVVMPAFEVFDRFARRVEREMPVSKKKDTTPKTKKCPICENECDIKDTNCSSCGHHFEEKSKPAGQKFCDHCGSANDLKADSCQVCGTAFKQSFTIRLEEALRDGSIVRGLDLSEEEVREAERIAPGFREEILRSGDEFIIQMLSKLPDEAVGRVKTILNAGSSIN